MFTGIIREVGYIAKRTPGKNGEMRLWLKSKMRPKEGASVAVNGVCLTVTQTMNNGFAADVIPETLDRTNLGALGIDAAVNLELSMKATDRFDGHFVTGHADSICRILKKGGIQNGVGLVIKLPKRLAPFVAEKGSVTLNGVSLTVAAAQKNSFTVALIPFTQKHTNLGGLKKGDNVNLEIDILARYVGATAKYGFVTKAANFERKRRTRDETVSGSTDTARSDEPFAAKVCSLQ